MTISLRSLSSGSVDIPESAIVRLGGIGMERLGRVKALFDPGNLFRTNHNIPAAIAVAAQ